MTKLLIIADDFTGALDTGIQFASQGIKTRVILYDKLKNLVENKDTNTQVLVIDAETRHLPKEQAYEVVYDIVKQAKKENIKFLYKKTDSALRGNIGSELAAVLKASNEKLLPFIPAFPKMNRITKDGIHYIDNSPVNETVFGSDPFEPVKYSSVKEIINSQNTVQTTNIKSPNPNSLKSKKGILIFDASTDENLKVIGNHLKENNMMNIMAGCAGFATVLPKILELSGDNKKNVNINEKLLVVCGSVNPITKKQLEHGEKCGFKRMHLTPKQKLEEIYWDSEEGLEQLNKIKYDSKNTNCFILDSNDKDDANITFEYAKSNGISVEETRLRISQTMGYILKKIVDSEEDSTFLVTGGDTLLGFMKKIGIKELTPISEIAPGCVLTVMNYNGKEYHVISKSGGFGEESLLKNITEILKK